MFQLLDCNQFSLVFSFGVDVGAGAGADVGAGAGAGACIGLFCFVFAAQFKLGHFCYLQNKTCISILHPHQTPCFIELLFSFYWAFYLGIENKFHSH